LEGWLGAVRRAVPAQVEEHLWSVDPETAAALYGSRFTPADVHLIGALAGLAGMLGVLLIGSVGGGPPWGLAAALAGAGVVGPRLWLRSVVTRHQAAVARELPRVAELLTLGTESGLGLLEAVGMASALCVGIVGRNLGVAVAEVNAGREVVSALRGVAGRLGGRPAASFVGSIVQGLELGAPIARVLRTQAEALRAARRQALEAQIAGLSFKLTLVTVLLFVPALFVLSVLPNLMAFLSGQW
jgi:pilus assembly protein TadC